jgi:hypothetical protein
MRLLATSKFQFAFLRLGVSQEHIFSFQFNVHRSIVLLLVLNEKFVFGSCECCAVPLLFDFILPQDLRSVLF